MLSEPITWTGVWWLPSKPERLLSGTLTASQDHIELEVIGNFEETDHAYLWNWVDQPRICGTTLDNRRITLEDCKAAGHSPRSPGPTSTRYRANIILIGANVTTVDEPIEFDEIKVRFSALDAWVTASGISHEMAMKEGGELESVGVKLTPLDSFGYRLANGDIVRISFRFDFRPPGLIKFNAELSETPSLGICFRKPAGFDDVFKATYQLRNFLTFAVGEPVRLLSLTGITHAEPDDDGPVQLELLYRMVNNPDLPTRQRISPEMVFTRAEAHERLSDVFNAWWDKEPLLRPVFDLYFGTVFSPGAYSEHRFLSYAQALETYHRRTNNRSQMPKPEFRERRRKAIELMPEEWQEWLGSKLAFANDLPLRERVTEILDLCPPVTQRVVGPDRDGFISLFVNTRNYRTHYSSSLEAKAARETTMIRLALQVQTLVETALLYELGFTCDEIVPMLERLGRFGLIANIKQHVANDPGDEL